MKEKIIIIKKKYIYTLKSLGCRIWYGDVINVVDKLQRYFWSAGTNAGTLIYREFKTRRETLWWSKLILSWNRIQQPWAIKFQ